MFDKDLPGYLGSFIAALLKAVWAEWHMQPISTKLLPRAKVFGSGNELHSPNITLALSHAMLRMFFQRYLFFWEAVFNSCWRAFGEKFVPSIGITSRTCVTTSFFYARYRTTRHELCTRDVCYSSWPGPDSWVGKGVKGLFHIEQDYVHDGLAPLKCRIKIYTIAALSTHAT